MKRMKVIIEPEKIYTLRFSGRAESGWRLESEWQGMKLFKKGTEIVILDCSPECASNGLHVFEQIFGDATGAHEALVIKASPAVLDRMKIEGQQ